MITIDDIKRLIIHEYIDANFINSRYIYDNIQLSSDKKHFYWNGVDIKLDINKISNISNNDRYSLIRELNQW